MSMPLSYPRSKGRASPLPSYSNAVQEKHYLTSRTSSAPWTTTFHVPIPRTGRRLRLLIPLPHRIWESSAARWGRKRATSAFFCAAVFFLWILFALSRRFGQKKQWPVPFIGDPPTLVYEREDLRRIWLWEIASGHYPSNRKIPNVIGFQAPPQNPGLPAPKLQRGWKVPASVARDGGITIGSGVNRTYFHANVTDPAYPPRPVPGSVIDLDIVQDNCNFSTHQYVRDCLEVLRMGAGLDNGNRLRRGKADEWKHIFSESSERETTLLDEHIRHPPPSLEDVDPNEGLEFSRKAAREPPLMHLAQPKPPVPFTLLPDACDPDYPRIYHIFWAGPFTDKPYLATLSFLFTQNLNLEKPRSIPPPKTMCRPQLWLWINPGPAAAVPNPSALGDMYKSLASNPWSAPFLHPRFEDVVKFKLWNTTEQLDGIPEIKDEWRAYEGTLFNSGGYVYEVKVDKEKPKQATEEEPSSVLPSTIATETLSAEELEEMTAPINNTAPKPEPDQKKKGGIYDRLGSTSQQDYDRMSVILSDMARFILCHRFGGTYLDADTILLRDWEELWGWKGAFAYRWSRLEKYNTAVLRLNKGSALGTFLFRTAFKNEFDFHPMTVSRYTKDAHLEGLLQRLPDALFDSAWLNTEGYQQDRPPFPYFTDFHHLFQGPKEHGGGPLALGFEAFFRGAYSYHFHNYWWEPFDPSRNWPDLGPRFIRSERAAREAAGATNPKANLAAGGDEFDDNVADDGREMSWATVLKRTFEGYIRGERPNMYGEWINWT